MTSKSQTFENQLGILKESVEKLDKPNLSLSDSLKTFEKGIAAYEICRQLLNEAGQRIRILTDSANGETFARFEEEGTL